MYNNIYSKMTTQRSRSANSTYYHYMLHNNDTNEDKYYMTLDQITNEYGISRSNIYLMCKNPDVERRKYNNLQIKKIHLHYLVVEQGIDPSTIH